MSFISFCLSFKLCH